MIAITTSNSINVKPHRLIGRVMAARPEKIRSCHKETG
jgi:hypothetical protein